MRWLPSFLGFAVFGYVYHWWSGDGRNASVIASHNFDILIGPKLTRTMLEFMLISLFVLLVLGWSQFTRLTRVYLPTVLKTYGLYALVTLNPPLLMVLSGVGDDESGGYIMAFFILFTIILEFIVMLCLTRPILKFVRPVWIGWFMLPTAFWGLWFGFFLWLFQPVVAVTCTYDLTENNLTAKIFNGALASQKFQSWAARLEPIPALESLPPIERITEVTTRGYNDALDTCRIKRAYDFKGAHNDLMLHIKFFAKDGIAYQAKVKASVSDQLELFPLGRWQVSKDPEARGMPLVGKLRERAGEPGLIKQHFETILQIIPALRKSSCIVFFNRHDKTEIVGDLDSINTINNLYLLRSSKLEQAWTKVQIRASLQRIAMRLGLGMVNSWELESNFGILPYACTQDKPYLGFQVLEDRFITRFPNINVKTSSKEFVVQLLLAVDTPELVVFGNHVDAFENDSYLFTPLPNDIPWTMVTTHKLTYTNSPLLPKQTPK